MEKQIILCASLDRLTTLYFSRWEYGKRVPGADSPFVALYKCDDEPYRHDKLCPKDFVILIESLIKWSEE